MVVLHRITSPQESSFSELIPVYQEAFPAEERRNLPQLERLLAEEFRMFFHAIECDGTLAGLFVYWELEGFYYLEHLAVFAEMRNKKIGQQLLDWVNLHLKGIRLLEAEPAETEIATRRVKYYERNGYQVLDRTYKQPSYDGKRPAIPLWIMGNAELEAETVKQYVEVIREEVYFRPRRMEE